MKILKMLLGLSSLGKIFIEKHSQIQAKLNLLAFKYDGEVTSPDNRTIIFTFPLNGDDIANKEKSGTAIFYFTEDATWRCAFGDRTDRNNATIQRFVSHYSYKINDAFGNYTFNDHGDQLLKTAPNVALCALELHFEYLRKSLEDGFEKVTLEPEIS